MKKKFFIVAALVVVLAFLPALAVAIHQAGVTPESGELARTTAYAPVEKNITLTNVINGVFRAKFRVFAVSKNNLGVPEGNYVKDEASGNYVYYPRLTPELFRGATYYIKGTQKDWRGGKTVDYVDLSESLAKCTVGPDGYTGWCEFKDRFPGKDYLQPIIPVINNLVTPKGLARAWGGHPDIDCMLPNKRGELQTVLIKYKNGVYCISDPALPDSIKEEARKQIAQSG